MALKDVPIDGGPTAPTAARNPRSRWAAVGPLLVLAVLFAGCGSTEADRVRRVYELARTPSEPNKNRIESMLSDDDRDVRAVALVAMEPIDLARATRMATKAIDDRDGFVRQAAVRILSAGVASDPALMRTLATQAGGDPDWLVRRQALEALAPVDDSVVREVFARALSDPVRQVRRAALQAGSQHPALLPLDGVCELVAHDSDWENRVDAARVLGESKDPAAYACLDAAVHDPNEFVRATVVAERAGLERGGVVEPAPPQAPPAEPKPRSGV